MNAQRLRRIAEQQTGIARKVLEAVPLREAWDLSAIARELYRHGTRIDTDQLEGCLRSLTDDGLIRLSANGRGHASHWQRVELPPVEEPARDIGETSFAAPGFVAPPPSALDRFAAVAVALRERAAQLTELADEIEAAALVAEEERAAGSTSDKKLRALRSLLRDIGVDS